MTIEVAWQAGIHTREARLSGELTYLLRAPYEKAKKAELGNGIKMSLILFVATLGDNTQCCFFGFFSAIPATDSPKFWVRQRFWLS